MLHLISFFLICSQNDIQAVHIMKVLIMQFPPAPLPWPSQDLDLVSSSAPCSQKPSAYATVSLTKFHTHIKQNSSVYFNVCILYKHKSFWTEW
jgi:hypothetical protein